MGPLGEIGYRNSGPTGALSPRRARQPSRTRLHIGHTPRAARRNTRRDGSRSSDRVHDPPRALLLHQEDAPVVVQPLEVRADLQGGERPLGQGAAARVEFVRQLFHVQHVQLGQEQHLGEQGVEELGAPRMGSGGGRGGMGATRRVSGAKHT